MNNGMYSSIKDDWCTPDNLFKTLDTEFNFVIDVAATDKNKKVEKCFTRESNGLQ